MSLIAKRKYEAIYLRKLVVHNLKRSGVFAKFLKKLKVFKLTTVLEKTTIKSPENKFSRPY